MFSLHPESKKSQITGLGNFLNEMSVDLFSVVQFSERQLSYEQGRHFSTVDCYV